MGIIEFVKEAGAKVFGKEEAEVAPRRVNVDPEELSRRKRQRALELLVRDLGLEVEELSIDLDGDTAVVKGIVDDQAEREKVLLAVGNVSGVARVDDRLETRNTAPPSQFYTVVPGDSLSKIARRFYGNAALYPKIFEANRPLLQDPDRIYPGQVLRIPPA